MGTRRQRTTKLGMALAAALGVLCAASANAALIDSFTHSYLGGAVVIDLNVYDGQAGPNPLLWEYTVTNNSYDPVPKTTNGFSGFEIYLPTPIAEIAAITPNGSSTPAWRIDQFSGHETEWDRKNSDGLGLMPGETGVFSFTTGNRGVAINNNGWFHSWANDVQTGVTYTTGMHVPWVPGLEPVPEPSTMILLGSGLAGLAACGRRRKQR